MNAIKAWAVKEPSGKMLAHTLSDRRTLSINEALDAYATRDQPTWKHLYRAGFRCVRVVVKEEE